jgi:hypothetical protein
MDGKAGTQWVSKVGVANDPKTLIIAEMQAYGRI